MRLGALALGVVLGVLLLGGVRLALVQPPSVHYHANFAVYVDGQRVDLSGDRYMEDVAACSADPDAVRPEDRVHLHEHNPDVVHVHHGGATWGHLFANLGMGLGADYLILAGGERFFSDEGRQVSFVVNGMQVPDVHNRLIRSEDRALISVGSGASAEALQAEFATVAQNAGEYNATQDPAGCAGSQRQWTFGERLKNAFWTL